jgi:hypothetical protein
MENNLDILNVDKLESYSNAFGDKFKEAWRDAGKNIKGTVKDAGKSISDQAKDASKNIKTTTKEIAHNDNLKKVGKGVLTFSAAVPRSSALMAFRVNLFGVSSRLYPAFLNDEELKKYNFDIENARKARESWEKIANFWEDKIGGSRQKLKEAISGAWNKPIFKTKVAKARKESTSGVAGYDDAAIAAYISVGLAIIGLVSKMITAKKNPYNAGSKQANDFQNDINGSDTDAPSTTREEEAQILADAKKEKTIKYVAFSGLALLAIGIATIIIYKYKHKKS